MPDSSWAQQISSNLVAAVQKKDTKSLISHLNNFNQVLDTKEVESKDLVKLIFILRDSFTLCPDPTISQIYSKLSKSLSAMNNIDKIDHILLSSVVNIGGNLLDNTDTENELKNVIHHLSAHMKWKILHIDTIFSSLFFLYHYSMVGILKWNCVEIWQEVERLVTQYLYEEKAGDRKKGVEVITRNLYNTINMISNSSSGTTTSPNSIPMALSYLLGTFSRLFTPPSPSLPPSSLFSSTSMKIMHYIYNSYGRLYNNLSTQLELTDLLSDHVPIFCSIIEGFISTITDYIAIDNKTFGDICELLLSVCSVFYYKYFLPYSNHNSVISQPLLKYTELCIVLTDKYIQKNAEQNNTVTSTICIQINKVVNISTSLLLDSSSSAEKASRSMQEYDFFSSALSDAYIFSFIYSLDKNVKTDFSSISSSKDMKRVIDHSLPPLQTHNNSLLEDLLTQFYCVKYSISSQKSGNLVDNWPELYTPMRALIDCMLFFQSEDKKKNINPFAKKLHHALTKFNNYVKTISYSSQCYGEDRFILCLLLYEWRNISSILLLEECNTIEIYNSLCKELQLESKYDYEGLIDYSHLLQHCQAYHNPHVKHYHNNSALFLSDSNELKSSNRLSCHSVIHPCCEFITHCKDLLCDKNSKPVQSAAELIAKYTICNDLLNSLPASSMAFIEVEDIYLLKIYFNLFLSKAMLYHCSAHYLATKYSKYALLYLQKLSPSTSSSIKATLHLEVLSGLLDAYDYQGKYHRVVEYLSEFEVALESSSLSVSRLGLYMELKCVALLLKMESEEAKERIEILKASYNIAEIRAAIYALSQQLKSRGVKVADNDDAALLSSELENVLLYRGIICSDYDSLDNLRLKRRAMSIVTNKINPPLSFLYNAASCYTSYELQMIYDSDSTGDAKENSNANMSVYDEHSSILQDYRKALQGDIVAGDSIHNILHNYVSANQQTLVCISIDHSASNLLVNTFDSNNGYSAHTISNATSCKEILADYYEIIQANNASLLRHEDIQVRFSEESSKSKKGKGGSKAVPMTNEEKQKWWDRRESINTDLHDNLCKMEAYLRPILSTLLEDEASILTSQIEQLDIDDNAAEEVNEIDYESMKVTALRSMAKERSISGIGRKQDIIDRLKEYDKNEAKLHIADHDSDNSSSSSNNANGIVLVLDESLQAYPLESIPSLRNKCCSRIPSLLMLLQTISNQRCLGEAVDIAKSWYAVDIENNLPSTRQTMMEYLNKYIKRYNWTGLVGEIPALGATRALCAEKDCFIYSGHNAGDKLFISHSDSSVESSFPNHKVSFLYGCSSVKMSRHGVYDPHGSVIYHLQAGTQCIVGNLWDVTDKDLDKLSIACLEKAMGESDEKESVVHALCGSRDVCKMPYAVGSAAVVYGIPVQISKL